MPPPLLDVSVLNTQWNISGSFTNNVLTVFALLAVLDRLLTFSAPLLLTLVVPPDTKLVAVLLALLVLLLLAVAPALALAPALELEVLLLVLLFVFVLVPVPGFDWPEHGLDGTLHTGLGMHTGCALADSAAVEIKPAVRATAIAIFFITKTSGIYGINLN